MSDQAGEFLTAADEFRFGRHPGNVDTDGGGIPDGVEFAYGLDPLNPADAHWDLDGDGVSNLDEYLAGTDFSDPQDVPAQTAELSPGLVGQYFTGQNLDEFVFTRVDEKVEFDWGSGSPANEIPRDVFSVRWVGYFVPPHEDGEQFYTFRARRDDGVRIYLDGERIMNRWSGGSTSSYYTVTRPVPGGEPIPLVIEYSEGYGSARIFFEIRDDQSGQRLDEASVLRSTSLQSPVSADSSGEGIPDAWALRFGLNPYEQNADKVLNSAGITVLQAYASQLDPRTLEPDPESTGGGIGSGPGPVSPSPGPDRPPVSSSSVTVSWTAPGTRLDGSSLSLSEIEAYEVLYGRDPNAPAERIEVGPDQTEYSFDNLGAGTWYFSVRVKDSDGLWSPNADIISHTVD